MALRMVLRCWRWLMAVCLTVLGPLLAKVGAGMALAAWSPAQAAAIPVVKADLYARDLPAVQISDQRETVLAHAWILPGGDVPPAAGSAWQQVPLPHRWSQTHPELRGTMWYGFKVQLADLPQVPLAVYLPRAIMNAQVWINGMPMVYTGSMKSPVTRNWYVPLLVQVPDGAWRKGENLIQVKVVSGYVGRNGLAQVMVGPLPAVEPSYKQRSLVQIDLVNFANVTLFALGVCMAIVWLRDREQRAIGFQGLAAILWGMGTTAMFAPNPFLPSQAWENLSHICMVWSQLLMCQFYWRFVGRRHGIVDVMVYGLMAFELITALFARSTTATVVIFLALYMLLLVSVFQAVRGTVRLQRKDGGWLLVGAAMLVPAAAHDVLYQANVLRFDSIYMLPYVGPLMMACIFYILAGDYARSRKALNRINDDLAVTVARREQELRESFERLSQLERAQAVSAERSRILRDMHDGVGAHLTSALRQLQSPRDSGVDLNLVTQTLRDSLDQLKLSIDALSLTPGDVVGLLASMRFRITPRLKAAGIELLWDVADLPPWPAGQAPALRQLQYILFEGLSNALQHSGATRLTLGARAFEDRLEVSLLDNGRGWTGAGEGQGLQTMRARAGVIGAKIEFRSPPEGGAELRVILPLHAQGASDLSSAA
ncbi:MAG: histidine kinase [Aquabacterium sp.]